MRAQTPNILDAVLSAPGGFSQENQDRGALIWLPVGRIYDNPFQPRQNYDDVADLAASIWALREELPATNGLQQPPVARLIRFDDSGDETPVARIDYADAAAVRRLALTDEYAVQLHFGHRRLRAWKLLRERDADAYAEFPVFLAYADDLGMWRHVVAENAQRKDINAIEEAETLRVAIERFHLTLEQAGEPFGYSSKSTVSNKLRLLNLPPGVADLVRAGQLTERHGRELVRLADAPARVEKLAELAVKKQLTVSQLAWNVENERAQEAKERERADQLATAAALLATGGCTVPGSSEPIPADRLRPDLDVYAVHRLNASSLRPCSGACPCLVAVHTKYPSSWEVPLRPETPNVILCCTDNARRAALQAEHAKSQAAAPGASDNSLAEAAARRAADIVVAQKAARRAEIIAQADVIWHEAQPQFDLPRLWNTIGFWRYALKRGANMWQLERSIKDDADTGAVCAKMLEAVKEGTRVYQDDAGATVYDLDKLRAVIEQLRAFSGAGRKRQREVSQETPAAPSDWERDWDDEDEASYQNLVADWDMNWRHLPVATDGVLNAGITRRCLLRLIEYCPYPDMVAELRRFAEQAVAA